MLTASVLNLTVTKNLISTQTFFWKYRDQGQNRKLCVEKNGLL